MTFDEVNGLPARDFALRFGHLFEHSPWVIDAAEKRRPFANKQAMLDAFAAVLDDAGQDRLRFWPISSLCDGGLRLGTNEGRHQW